MREGDVDVDLRGGIDGVQLDLLDAGGVVWGGGGVGVGGAFAGDFGGAGPDARVRAGDVVEEDFLGLVPGGGDSVGTHVGLGWWMKRV